MRITYVSSYEEMSRSSLSIVKNAVHSSPSPQLILATGHSPLGLYQQMAQSKKDFQQLTVIKLDEWIGLPMDHPSTCEYFLQKHVLQPLEIPTEKYLSMSSESDNPTAECDRIAEILNQRPTTDLCILGLGKNGHLGLNEPAATLSPACHLIELEPSSQQHDMLKNSKAEVTQGITLGIGEILRSKKILLLITGQGKQSVFDQLKKKEISTDLPASFLWLHPDVEVIVDQTHIQ